MVYQEIVETTKMYMKGSGTAGRYLGGLGWPRGAPDPALPAPRSLSRGGLMGASAAAFVLPV